MPSMNTILMAVAITLAPSVKAHISLTNPSPYGHGISDQIKVPVLASSFPCHFDLGVYDDKTPPTSMAIGAPQGMTFKGTAVHGGGSCQISLTKDKRPTKDSKWEVINSIIGGCPIDLPGNANGTVEDPVQNTIKYSIPNSFQPGDYTLAWTWFNFLGNREMYMNCAPITVTGGSKRRAKIPGFSKRADSLPDMFVANIANGCLTVDGVLLDFPNPGPTVQHFGEKPKGPPTGSCGAGVSAATASGGSGAAPPAAASGAPSGSADSGAAPAPATPVVPTAPTAPVASTAPVAPAAPAPASPDANSSAGGCTSSGQSVCSPDGKQIGTCDATNHVTFMAVADGTVCKGGYMVMAKRSAKFAHGHTRRGHSLGRW